ncbi:protein phosphatase Slingshot homolog 2 isoform X3 [Alosa sapidissima]|uniref:protein phosphatase Slingshot homolog 2 isoform X3 n=1 Tax=Alosa sapidissima TaxID=34773 RepID=UPI001C0802B7|nr:protein phosphatase Slingshot homolog 2 isoform X3 [Alosa sapidissima]
MTLGTVASTRSSAPGCFCSCCGAKMVPYFSENAVVSQNQINQLISENFLTVKGAALFLPRGNGSSPSPVPRIAQRRNKHTGDLQQHLQTMFTLLRPEDTIRLAVRLESAYLQCTRYMVVVSTNGRQDTEESVVLGMDFSSSDRVCTVGLVLPLWSDTLIHLDGDGGFSVSTVNRVHVFKPVSVQAMWAALQSLHKACEVARCHNYYPGSLFLTWVSYYHSRVASDQVCINEWNAMQDVQSHRADSPVLFTDVPTERERTERLIKMRLREIMMQMDLENVTSKQIRTELEMQMTCNLREFKEFIDNEMIVILGQMDSPTEIFDHVFLGSEWNASNLEELQNSGVRYILNVTREIDNFFPGLFEYHNIRVYDEEATNLLEYWNDTFKFISKAKKAGAKCLVHCKMGVSRSASTVIAYAMKEYGWDLEHAFDYVKERRAVTKPNPSFMKQLEEYQGILLASKQRHNKLWRSHSDGDLSEPLVKSQHHALDHSDPLNNNGPASLQHFLGMAVLQALGAEPQPQQEQLADRDGVRTRSPSPPTSNGLCDSEEHLATSSSVSSSTSHPVSSSSEDPFLPPLPRPRAATLVPKARLDVAAFIVAEAVPAARPHPPPSLHLLPQSSSPEPRPDSAGSGTIHHHLPTSAGATSPDPTELPLDEADEADGSVSEEQQQQQLAQEPSITDSLQLSLDTLSEGVGGPGLASSAADTPMALTPLSPSGSALSLSLDPHHGDEDDDNNNNNNISSHLQPSDNTEEVLCGSLPEMTTHSGSSSLSTDSIDFFSAREKFLGLSQDGIPTRPEPSSSPRAGQCRWPSQELPQQPQDEQEQEHNPAPSDNSQRKGSPPPEDGCSPVGDLHPDNGVSVRHMVTELESISHIHLPHQQQPAPRNPQQPPLHSPDSAPELPSTPSPPPPSLQPPSPTTPTRNWATGSVRRVRKQLEQRLRQQELDCPVPACAPAPVPSSPPPTSCSPQPAPSSSSSSSSSSSLGPEHRTASPQPGAAALDEACTEPEEAHCSDAAPVEEQDERLPLDLESGALPEPPLMPSPPPPPPLSSFPACPESGTHTHLPTPPAPESCVQHGLLWLEGVTEMETDTDGPSSVPAQAPRPYSRLARSSEDLEKIQQTLQELQAFLYEAGGARGPEAEPGQGSSEQEEERPTQQQGEELGSAPTKTDSRSSEARGPAVWQRAMEIEARIRQAGLTPPSLMKRSASLAKLDCLELSTHDLSSWDFHAGACPAPSSDSHLQQQQQQQLSPQVPSLSLSPSPVHPVHDDAYKKQRVLHQSPTSNPRPGLCVQEDVGRTAVSPSGPPSPHPCSQHRSKGRPSAPDHAHSHPQPSLHGKPHPLRRLRKAADKKRTVTVLYNTM